MSTTTAPEQMTFGTTTANDTGDGDTSGDWIHRFSKNGEYRLRFLQEYNDWLTYWEHFSMEKKASYPCTAQTAADKKNCPGCTSEDPKEAKASKKYLVNAVLMDPSSDKQGYAHLWKMPFSSLKEDLLRYQDRSAAKTLTDRDYTIVRYEASNGVRYSVDREDKDDTPLDLSIYPLQDFQTALRQEWMEAWDPETRAAKQAEYEERKAAKDKANGQAADKADEAAVKAEETPEPDPVPRELMTKEERAAADAKPASKVTMQADEDEVAITPSAIRKMEVSGLLALYRQGGLDVPEDVDQSDRDALAERLIQLLS